MVLFLSSPFYIANSPGERTEYSGLTVTEQVWKDKLRALLEKLKVGVEIKGDECRLGKMDDLQFRGVKDFVDANATHIKTVLYQSEAGKILVVVG